MASANGPRRRQATASPSPKSPPPPGVKQINAAPSLEKAKPDYDIDGGYSWARAIAAVGVMIQTMLPALLSWGMTMGLIFGGCCSNASFLFLGSVVTTLIYRAIGLCFRGDRKVSLGSTSSASSILLTLCTQRRTSEWYATASSFWNINTMQLTLARSSYNLRPISPHRPLHLSRPLLRLPPPVLPQTPRHSPRALAP